jgi:cyclin-dependent kinase 7
MKDGTLKIIDFGSCKQYGSPQRPHSKNVITKNYRPPEILFGSKFYGPAVDIWSVGCILGEFLIREIFFPGRNEFELLG